MTGFPVLPQTGIEIGHHVEGTFGGLTFNLDTIWSTVVAGAAVLALGFLARRAITKKTDDHVPTKVQLLWEGVVNEVQSQVEANLGRVHPFVVPLAVALFFFILIANWLELIPSEPGDLHLLPAPTADINVTLSMALLVMVGVWIFGVRENGLKNYLKHFVEPYPALLPLNILEELTKPFTLALRLFGNIFAGGIMIALIGLMPIYVIWAPNVVWKLFDMFIGAIQAFIFALLTVLYFGAATGHSESHESDDEVSPETDPGPGEREPEREPEREAEPEPEPAR